MSTILSTFVDDLQASMLAKKTVLCAGVDPQLYFMPPHIRQEMKAIYRDPDEALAEAFYTFYRAVIEAVAPYVAAVKFQAAFWEKSSFGWRAQERLIAYAYYLGLVVIRDGKRFDGGDTADAYAEGHIGEIQYLDDTWAPAPIRVDALTIGGWIGEDCVTRFVKQMKKHGTGAFVVDKTSFKPNSVIEQLVTDNGLTVWERLAHYVALWGEGTEGKNGYRNLGVVMGATKPDDVPKMREILPKAIYLGPGFGGQGASADDCALLFNSDGFGAVISDSRRISAAWLKGDFKCDPKQFDWAAGQAARIGSYELNQALKHADKYPF